MKLEKEEKGREQAELSMSDLTAVVRIFTLIPTKMKSKNGSDFEQRRDIM